MYEGFLESGLKPEAYWNKHADDYQKVLKCDYHAERLSMIDRLISGVRCSYKNIFDFGCGDGNLILSLAKHGAEVSGCDISDKMIAAADKTFAESKIHADLWVGGIESLIKIPDSSCDLILCINVLAYLDRDEDKLFYEQCHRILRPSGELIVTNSNELFDMFTFNAFTINFYMNNFGMEHKGIEKLICNSDVPRHKPFNIRMNPLSYGEQMKPFGFLEEQQEFSHYHPLPPLLMDDDGFVPVPTLSNHDKWKLMFQCSIYGSRLVRSGTKI
jgi:2-polyprenyl-3-methyl-5-hydroxy-6-metoxy-1,4-benzoquinol methylase